MWMECPECKKDIYVRKVEHACCIAVHGCKRHSDYVMDFAKGHRIFISDKMIERKREKEEYNAKVRAAMKKKRDAARAMEIKRRQEEKNMYFDL